jgi:proteasome lid subunit RPN8/RPN11
MEISVERELLGEMLAFAKDRHPHEAILLLRGNVKKDVITLTDYLFPPYARTDSVSASYPVYMLPIDFSIVGTFHSHPSGSLQASAVDMINIYGRFSMIAGFPYEIGNVAAYNKAGDRMQVTVTD